MRTSRHRQHRLEETEDPNHPIHKRNQHLTLDSSI